MSTEHFAIRSDSNPNIWFTSRAAAERDIARGIGVNVAGAPVGTEIAERAPARPSDGYPVFKAELAKAYGTPHGLEKSEPAAVETKPIDATECVAGPVSVTDLIRKAQGNPGAIEDLARGYSGRECAAVAKAAAKPKEVTASDLDRVSPELRKAIGGLDAIVRRAMKRAMAV